MLEALSQWHPETSIIDSIGRLQIDGQSNQAVILYPRELIHLVECKSCTAWRDNYQGMLADERHFLGEDADVFSLYLGNTFDEIEHRGLGTPDYSTLTREELIARLDEQIRPFIKFEEESERIEELL